MDGVLLFQQPYNLPVHTYIYTCPSVLLSPNLPTLPSIQNVSFFQTIIHPTLFCPSHYPQFLAHPYNYPSICPSIFVPSIHLLIGMPTILRSLIGLSIMPSIYASSQPLSVNPSTTYPSMHPLKAQQTHQSIHLAISMPILSATYPLIHQSTILPVHSLHIHLSTHH